MLEVMRSGPAVAHINKYWGRDRGGVEAVVHACAGDLAERGYAVSVLACRPWGTAARAAAPGVAVRELAAPVVARMPVHPRFAARLRDCAARHQLLHFHLPFPLAEAAALDLPKRQPWVATLHAEVVGHAAWMRRLQSQVTREFLGRCDLILVSSPAVAEAAMLAGFRERVQVLPFGFDLAPYRAAARQAPEPRPLRAVFLGRMVKYKGLDVLLRAAALLPPALELELRLIGDGPERRRLERRARQLRLPRCHFLGHVPDGALPAELAAARIFVLPSLTRAETFGVAQVEAMAAGCAVVNTALPTGVPWVSPHGVTGLTVEPGNPEALAAALEELARDEELRRACGRRAQERAWECFRVERQGAALAARYEEVMPCRRPVQSVGPAPTPFAAGVSVGR